METNVKPSVLNPLVLRNTVGAELADILEARGINESDALMGVSDLRAKEKLTKPMIKKLQSIFTDYETVIAFLERFQEEYLQEKIKCKESYIKAKRNFTKLKKALPLMKGEFTDGYDLLDDILDFFGADSEDEIFEASEKQAALFRTQNNVAVDPINLYVWLRRGELDFQNMQLPQYNEDALKEWIESREWLKNIDNPIYFKSLPEVFKSFGIALTLVPYLKKTVYGAVRWRNDHPLIEISDRNRDLATCWFTLFHELGHVILHRNVEIFEGDINSTTVSTKREREANKFANRYLFNGDELRKAVFNRRGGDYSMTANSLAQEFGTNPIFAAYWLIKAQYAPTLQPHISIDFVAGYQ